MRSLLAYKRMLLFQNKALFDRQPNVHAPLHTGPAHIVIPPEVRGKSKTAHKPAGTMDGKVSHDAVERMNKHKRLGAVLKKGPQSEIVTGQAYLPIHALDIT